MKRTLLLTAIVSVLTTSAFASNIVTSKTYVDNRDNLKVDIAQGVGTNNANVGKTLVVNSQGNLELGTVSADNFVEDSITDGVTTKAPSENAVHDALAGKQNTIPVTGTNASTPGATVVTYTSTAGTIGERGILDIDNDVEWIPLNNNPGNFYRMEASEGHGTDLIDAEAFSDITNSIWWELDNMYGDSGTIVMRGNDGMPSASRAIYDGSTTYNSTTDTDKLVTAGVVETKQAKKTCAGWPDGVEHTDANCWLWNMPD